MQKQSQLEQSASGEKVVTYANIATVKRKLSRPADQMVAVNKSVDFGHLRSLSKKKGPFAFQREGKLRELHNMTDLKDNKLENELLETMHRANSKGKRRYKNQSISQTGERYYLSTRGPDLKTLQRQSLDIERKRKDPFDITYRPKVLFKNYKDDDASPEGSVLPAIEPMLKRRIDDTVVFPQYLDPKDQRLIIQDHSITQRYLTRNVYQPHKLPVKESIRDSIDNLRKIQYIHQKISERVQEIDQLNYSNDAER